MHRTHTPRRSETLCASLAVAMILAYAMTPTRAAVSPATQTAGAQTAEREKLLNGLSFFLLPQSATGKVTLRLRIHSGAAFDLAGKEGTAALLARSLFPDETTRSYVEEELGGSLVVAVDYDKLDVTLAGRADSLPILLELLRNALVTGGTIDAKTFDSIRARHVADLSSQKAAASIADEMIARRLFGAYPLGRPTTCTAASVGRIERPDLIYARERFLAPDNATLVITGNFDPARTRILMRQYLGAWRKADRLARATFRQPVAPPSETLVVPATIDATCMEVRLKMPNPSCAEMRLAFRAPSRSDRDYPAALLMASVLSERLEPSNQDESDGRDFRVRYTATKLAGALTLGVTARAHDAAAATKIMRDEMRKLAATPPAVNELNAARGLLTLRFLTVAPDERARALLDADTYGVDAEGERARLDALTPIDIQQLAAKLLSAGEPASVAAGEPTQITTSLAQNGVQTELSTADVPAAQNAAPASVPNRSREVPRSPLVITSPSSNGESSTGSAPTNKTPTAKPTVTQTPTANRP